MNKEQTKRYNSPRVKSQIRALKMIEVILSMRGEVGDLGTGIMM